MAYYAYKKVRDLLIKAGCLDEYGNPADKVTHGELLETDYTGNIHDIAAEHIQSLENERNEMRDAMNTFVDRVEAGEVRSTRTYTQFKAILGR